MIAERFTPRFDNGPIDNLEELERFVTTRAAFIAQKTMYGYIKTRMGTKYPEMFRDDAIIVGVNLAKMHMFAACLSDLTIFASAVALDSRDINDAVRRTVALRFYRHGIAENPDDSVEKFSPDEAIAAFETRLTGVEWSGRAMTRDIFTEGPKALMKWAPVAENLKKLDVEPAQNSVRFAWNNIRANLRKRLDAEAIQQCLLASRDRNAKATDLA